MSNESDFRCGQHCVFKLHVHLVFAAKYRRRVFDAQAIDVLRGVFIDVCSDVHATLVEMDGEGHHVHPADPRNKRTAHFTKLHTPHKCG